MSFTLTLRCVNRPGIVAAVATVLFAAGGNITEAQQFDDTATGQFFMRVVFDLIATGADEATVRVAIGPVAARFDMAWSLHDRSVRRRVLIMVSALDHCLVDLLYRWRIGELTIEPVGIVSNHPRETFAGLELGEIPFYHLPTTTPEKRYHSEVIVVALVERTRADLVVLARYMQVLSRDLAEFLEGRCINIHHSFLPGFKGARPYHQAHVRGVKLIGATAHFVTAALDEGPIIEQDVARVSHQHRPDDMVRLGRDVERRVLARAVRLFVEDRVILNGDRTIVFD